MPRAGEARDGSSSSTVACCTDHGDAPGAVVGVIEAAARRVGALLAWPVPDALHAARHPDSTMRAPAPARSRTPATSTFDSLAVYRPRSGAAGSVSVRLREHRAWYRFLHALSRVGAADVVGP